MKFVCPKCSQVLTVADNRVPENGAWARCPKCRDRFYLTPKPVDLAAPLQPAPLPAGGRSAEAQKLLDRMRGRDTLGGDTSPGEPDGGGSGVTIFPEAAPNYFGYGLGVAVLAGLFLAAMIGAFRYDGPGGGTPAAAVFPVRAVDERAALREDLMAIRRDLSRRENVLRRVDYPGHESRLYKYCLAELAPGQLRDIVGLRLRSADTAAGFTVSAEGLDARLPLPELNIRWAGESAVVSIVGLSKSLEVDLAAPPGPAANSASE